MGARAEALAKQFEEASKAVADIVARLSDAEWKKMTSGEKWTVGVVAHHVALGHAGIANIVMSVASEQSLPNFTMANLVEMNAQHARAHASCTTAQTLELHNNNVATAASVRAC